MKVCPAGESYIKTIPAACATIPVQQVSLDPGLQLCFHLVTDHTISALTKHVEC